MLSFIRDYFLKLVVLFFSSFFISYFITVNYLVIKVHRLMLNGKEFNQINIGLITFIIFAFLPMILWKMTKKSEIPILKETNGLRYLLSCIAVVFTMCFFLSKEIFNAIAKMIINWNSNIVFDEKGRIVLVEIISVGIPLVLFLYFSKKVITYFLKESEE